MKVWVTFGEMGRTLKKRQLEKRRLFSRQYMCKIYGTRHHWRLWFVQNGSHKTGSQLQKLVTLFKMGDIWRNGPHLQKWVTLENWVTFGEMGHTWKNVSLRQKWVTLAKNVLHLEKRVTLLQKVLRYWSWSRLRKCVYFAFINGSHLQKWVTVAKNWSHFIKWVTITKMGYTWKIRSRL